MGEHWVLSFQLPYKHNSRNSALHITSLNIQKQMEICLACVYSKKTMNITCSTASTLRRNIAKPYCIWFLCLCSWIMLTSVHWRRHRWPGLLSPLHTAHKWGAPPVQPLRLTPLRLSRSLQGKERKIKIMRVHILTAVTTKSTAFWDVTPCSMVEVYWRFKEMCCLHPQGSLLLWRWRQNAPPKQWLTCIRLHCTIFQKTVSSITIKFSQY